MSKETRSEILKKIREKDKLWDHPVVAFTNRKILLGITFRTDIKLNVSSTKSRIIYDFKMPPKETVSQIFTLFFILSRRER